MCGLDHANKCRLLSGRLSKWNVYTLVVRRPNAKLKDIKLKSNVKKGLVVVDIPPVEHDRSSTIVRKLLVAKNWQELKKYLHPKVLQYLRDDPDEVIVCLY